MLDVVIDMIIALVAAVVVVFLILIAINIALFFKLRSIIPTSPRARPPVTPHRAPDSDSATRQVHPDLLRQLPRNANEPMMARHPEQGLPGPQAASGTAVDTLGLTQFPLILMYHRLAEVPENRMCVTPGRFAEQMRWLKRHGLRGVGVGTLIDAMRAGRQRGLVGITFDDGFDNLVEAALPELLRHGFTATMFIVSGLLGGTNEWDGAPVWPLMSADQVRELAGAGMEIGSHGTTHLRLAGIAAKQLEAEVSGSRASLGELIGAPIRGFAYPFGSMDAAARGAVRDAGYDYACAVWTPVTELGFMALPRMFIGERDTAIRMIAKRLVYRPYLAVHGMRAETADADHAASAGRLPRSASKTATVIPAGRFRNQVAQPEESPDRYQDKR